MWVQQCHKPSPNHLPFYRWYVYQPFPVLAPQALGHRVAGLSEHEHDGQGATVSLFCLASSLFYVHAYIYLSIYIYSINYTSAYTYTYIHTYIHYLHTSIHTCIHAYIHPCIHVRTYVSRSPEARNCWQGAAEETGLRNFWAVNIKHVPQIYQTRAKQISNINVSQNGQT